MSTFVHSMIELFAGIIADIEPSWTHILCHRACDFEAFRRERCVVAVCSCDGRQGWVTFNFNLAQVLIPTWFGFAIAGMIMFGRRMQAGYNAFQQLT